MENKYLKVKNMKIIIIGSGKVGRTIVKHISKEGHDLCIIDSNPKIVDELVNRFDILGVTGNGASLEIQKKAEVDKSDLVIACTSSDEVNILACLIAKKIGTKNTIARIRNRDYFSQVQMMKKDLGLSMIINPELEAANEIVRMLDFPQALKIDNFSRGRLNLVEIFVGEDSPLVGQNLQEIRQKYKVQVLVCAVQRADEALIPHGGFVVSSHDKLHITGTRTELINFLSQLGIIKAKINSVILIGGGKISNYLGEKLIHSKYKLKIVEANESRCLELSEQFPKATVICGDGTDQDILKEEGIEHVDACISLTGIDEENIITAMYANKLGVKKVISKVNRDSFVGMLESTGVASVVSPKNIAANRVVRYVRALKNSSGSNAVSLYKVANDQVEAVEFVVNNESSATEIPLKDLNLKSGILIAAIIHNNETKIPGANDVIKDGDSVIVITNKHQLNSLDDILA